MSFDDALFWIALTIFGTGLYLVNDSHLYGLALIVIGGAGLAWSIRTHIPRSSLRMGAFAVAMVMTWAVVGYDIYERHQTASLSIYPLPDKGARIEVTEIRASRIGPNGIPQLIDLGFANRGTKAAMRIGHFGTAVPSPICPPTEAVDKVINALKTMLPPLKEIGNSEMPPNSEVGYFAVPTPPFEWTSVFVADFANGRAGFHLVNVIRYTDESLPPGEVIYRETSVLVTKDNQLFCPAHNRSYVAGYNDSSN